MSLFGWSYPPGAASDPFAPYNQVDDYCERCEGLVDECTCPEHLLIIEDGVARARYEIRNLVADAYEMIERWKL